MPVRNSCLITSLVLLIVPAMTPMPTVKEVHKRAKQQQAVRQDAENMRLVFLPKKKAGNPGKPEKN